MKFKNTKTKDKKMNKRIFTRGGRLYLDCQENGTRKRVATGLKDGKTARDFAKKHFALFFKDKAQALQKWDEFANKAFDRAQMSKSDFAFSKLAKKGDEKFFIAQILDKLQAEKSFLKIRTQQNFKSDKKSILEFCEQNALFDIRHFSREHCVGFTQFLREKDLGKESILGRLKTLGQCLKFALASGLIDKNPYFVPKMSDFAPKEQIEPFNLDEAQMLIKAASGELKSYLIIAFFTGARTGEILGLKFSDIDFAKNEICILRTKHSSGQVENTPKTNKARVIDMLAPVKNELLAMKGGGEFVFNIKSDKLHKDFYELCERVGAKAQRLYNTRHSFASIMLSRGEEPAWVGLKMLGHATLSTTFKYYAKYLPRSVQMRASFVNELDLGVDEPNLFKNLA